MSKLNMNLELYKEIQLYGDIDYIVNTKTYKVYEIMGVYDWGIEIDAEPYGLNEHKLNWNELSDYKAYKFNQVDKLDEEIKYAFFLGMNSKEN